MYSGVNFPIETDKTKHKYYENTER